VLLAGTDSMHVGVMRIELEVPGARSLKDKRQVVRSFKERVKSRLSVSIAEVGYHDKLQRAAFGVAVVSPDAGVCEELLGQVIGMASSLPNALVADRASEIIPFGEGGAGVRGGIEQLGDDEGFASRPFDPDESEDEG
jgi:uncharacterized protein